MLPAWFTFYDGVDNLRFTSRPILQTEQEWFDGNPYWPYAGVLPRDTGEDDELH